MEKMKTTKQDFNISQSDMENFKKAQAEVAQSFKGFQAAIGKAGCLINKDFLPSLFKFTDLSQPSDK